MQTDCTSKVRVLLRWWSTVCVAICVLFSSVPAAAQVTFGTATIGDITAEVGQRIASRVLPAASGGSLPYTYSLPGLPNGLEFSGSDRVLSGTPTSIVSTTTYTYTVQDNNGATATIDFDITVNSATALRVSTTSSDNSITVNWYGLGTADSYCLTIRAVTETNSSGCTTINSNGSVDLLTHTFQNLELATRYSIFIEAYNSLNSPIESITVTTSTSADETPRFASSARIDDIDVRAGLLLISPILPEATGGNGTLTYEFDPMLPAGLTLDTDRQITGRPTTPQSVRRYLYKAVDADGDFASLTFTIRIQERVPVTGIKTTVGNSSLTVHWDAVSIASSYLVRYRQRGSTQPWDETSSTTNLSETISGLINDQVYDIRVVVLDESDNELTYGDTTATPGSASQIVVSASGGDGEVLVTWNAIELAQRYRIRYQRGGSTANFIDSGYATSVPVGGFKVMNLVLSTEYTIRVDAYGATNNLLSSDTDTATTLGDTSPTFGSTAIDPIPIYLGKQLDQTLPQRTSGGNQPFVYTISPRLPTGLSFDSDTQTISGIPASDTIASIYTYRVRDRQGDTASITFTLEIRSYFAKVGSSASVREMNPDFADINDVLARDRVIPDGSTTEPRMVSYRLDSLSAQTFAVTASTANHKAPVLALAQRGSLDFEKGPRTHNIRIIGTSPNNSGAPITLGVYALTLNVLDVDEPPQKTEPPNSGEPDEEVFAVSEIFRDYVLTNRFFDPEQRGVTIDTDSLRITNAEATIVYASGSTAGTISAADQVVKAEIVSSVLLRVRVDTSQIRSAQTLTNDVRVTARDPGNLQSEEFVVRFNVKIGANNPPTFIGGATAVSSTVPENTVHVGEFYATDLDDHVRSSGRHNDTLTFSIQGATRHSFSNHDILLLDGACLYVETSRDDTTDRWVATVSSLPSTYPDGSTQCRQGFDFEEGVTPRFVLEVSDSYGGHASVFVTIHIENVDEPATHDISNLSQFQLYLGSSESVDLYEYISDPENTELVFVVNTFNSRIATVSEKSGVLTVTGVGPGRTTISVSYRDAGGHVGSFQVVAVVKNSTTNSMPRFLKGVDAVGYEVDENSPGGTPVGQRNIATDDDAYDELTYSIDAYDDVFEVSSKRGSEGQLSVRPGATLNFESQSTYNFTLSVDDGWGGNDTLEVTITVTDVNEPPRLNPGTTANGRIADVHAAIDEEFELDLKPYFVDKDAIDQGRLRYRVSLANRIIASVQTTATGLMLVTGQRLGTSEATVTTTDSVGQQVSLSFTLKVVENSPPVVRNPIPDQELNVGQIVDIPLSDVFYDEDGDVKVTKAIESDESVVLAILTKNKTELALFGYSVGVADVTIRAADSAGSVVEDEFTATVTKSASAGGPRLANRIGDQTITAGIERTIDISTVFAFDESTELLKIEVQSVDENIAHGVVDLSSMILKLNGYAPGHAYVTVVATTKNDTRIGDLFTTYVETKPEVVETIADVELEIGGNVQIIDFGHAFIDRDGDHLQYTIEVEDPSRIHYERVGTSLRLTPVRRGDSTVAISARDPKGRVAMLTFDVTVGNDGLRSAAEKSLANFGRTLLSGVSSAIEARVNTDIQASDFSLSNWLASLGQQRRVGDQLHSARSSALNEDTAVALVADISTIRDFRTPRSFALGFGGEQPSWSLWSHGDQQHLEDDFTAVKSRSQFFGVDVRANDRWLLGLALGQSQGQIKFQFGSAVRDMTIDSWMVMPYLNYEISRSAQVWSVVGKGSGTIEIGKEQSIELTPLQSKLWLVGGRQRLAEYRNLEFAFRGDHARLLLQTSRDRQSTMQLESSIERSRVGIETCTELTTRLGKISPSINVGVRYDGGMQRIGSGLEVTTGLKWTSQDFVLEAKTQGVRTGTTIQSSASMTIGLRAKSNGTGLAFMLEPKWGTPLSISGLTFDDGYGFGLVRDTSTEAISSRAVSAEVGYGIKIQNDTLLLHPFVRYDEENLHYKLGMVGARLGRKVDSNHALQVELAFGANKDRRTTSTEPVFSARASFKF